MTRKQRPRSKTEPQVPITLAGHRSPFWDKLADAPKAKGIPESRSVGRLPANELGTILANLLHKEVAKPTLDKLDFATLHPDDLFVISICVVLSDHERIRDYGIKLLPLLPLDKRIEFIKIAILRFSLRNLYLEAGAYSVEFEKLEGHLFCFDAADSVKTLEFIKSVCFFDALDTAIFFVIVERTLRQPELLTPEIIDIIYVLSFQFLFILNPNVISYPSEHSFICHIRNFPAVNQQVELIRASMESSSLNIAFSAIQLISELPPEYQTKDLWESADARLRDLLIPIGSTGGAVLSYERRVDIVKRLVPLFPKDYQDRFYWTIRFAEKLIEDFK